MKNAANVEKFPVLEVVYRAGDTRPVVAQIFGEKGEPFSGNITPGTCLDLEQLEAAIEAILPMISAGKRVRWMFEHLEEFTAPEAGSNDDPPF